jgi:hypothetical protein
MPPFALEAAGDGKQESILLLVFWANKVAREIVHVAGLSRPSDQPNQRSRSGRYRSFCKKALELSKNSTRGPGFFHMNP